MSNNTELEQLLNKIKTEKDTKIIPENIKKGVTIFNIDGTLSAVSYDDTLAPSEYIQALSLTQNILGVQEYIDVDLFDNGVFEAINTMVFTSLGGATTGSMTIGTTINTTQKGSDNLGSEYKLVTDVPVDFTKITKLKITFTTAYTGDKGRFYIAIPKNPDSITSYNDTVPDIVLTEDAYSGTAEIDVSSYTGERYILFRIGSGIFDATRTLSISKIQIIEEVL